MSIKAKLSAACFLLILVNVSVGVFSHMSQQRMAALGFDIYDRAFMAMSYLRSSQNGLARLRVTLGAAADATERRTVADVFSEVLSDVQVARERAMSPEGSKVTSDLAERLSALMTRSRNGDPASFLAEIEHVQATFETAVEIYAGDGYLYRRKMQDLVERSFHDTWIAVATSVAIAFVITSALWMSIIPALRSAVAIARAISAGKLDSAFPARGSDETAILLKALSGMQDSLVDKLARIDALALEAQARAAELTVQNGRFEAALDNMNHGLCMIDVDRRLVVANHRFVDMFGGASPSMQGDIAQWALFPRLGSCLRDAKPVTEELPDGRVIRIDSQPVRDGGSVITFDDVTERHHAETKLFHMSRYDLLTGLPNRALFRESLEENVRNAGRLAGPTVLYVDLDGFKTVNDTLGHGVGDELLRSVATRLQDSLGPAELISRLGGDEFAIILRSGDQTEAEKHASGLVEVLSQPFDLPPHRISIGASVGIAIRREGDAGLAPDVCTTLLKNADVALYRAKADGKGTFRFHTDELDVAVKERQGLETDLRSALERGEFVLVFQPIVAAAGDSVSGFEALLRWHHPERGIIPPTTFIPIAEETGLIASIGRWVLRGACAEAATWPDHVKVAVNLSPVQFRQSFLVADVVRALADAQIAPGRLELEITESVLIQDTESVVATLMQLRSLGVRIALDDFGTGYSSLSYLRKFPFDKLKIDRSFVQNLSDADNLAILQAMAGLGRALNVAVVAEGVETAEQAEQLRREGCSELQGYHFGRPGPAQGIPDVLQRLAALPDYTDRLVG